MSVETFDLAKSIHVTPAAAAHFREQLDRNGGQAVRIGLKKSGCTGYKYAIEETEAPGENDILLNLENGVVVYFHPSDAPALQGTEIDYTKEGVNRVLKIENPNVSNECGCGESFDLKLDSEDA